MDTIRRLEQGLADTEAGHVEGTSRMVRSAMALRARDARAVGASLRDIGTELLGGGEWPGPGEYRKSAIRRLVSMGERLVMQGPLPILTWYPRGLVLQNFWRTIVHQSDEGFAAERFGKLITTVRPEGRRVGREWVSTSV